MEDKVNKNTKGPNVWALWLVLAHQNLRRLIELYFLLAFDDWSFGDLKVLRRIDIEVEYVYFLRTHALENVLLNEL